MPKTSADDNVHRKYVLVDKPIFSKGKEGQKFLFKREKNQSYAFAIKKFFLKPLMRAEAKKQIANILKSESFKDSDNSKDLLAKINATPFWKGVQTEDFLNFLERAALEKNDVFCKPDKTVSAVEQQNPLRELLDSAFPDLLNDFDRYQNEYKENFSPGEDEKYTSSEECEEDFSSFESEDDVSAEESQKSDSSDLFDNENFAEKNNIQANHTPKKYEVANNNNNFETAIFHNNSKKEPGEKAIRKQPQKEYLKKENSQLEIIQAIEQDELAEIIKKKYSILMMRRIKRFMKG
jgi:hypothetical protein